MKKIIKKIYVYLNMIRSIIPYLAYCVSNNESKLLIEKDMYRWINTYKLDNNKNIKFLYLNWLLVNYKEFRNIYVYRIKNTSQCLAILIKIIYPVEKSLYIVTPEIGGGLMIFHGFSTIINAKKIGENFSVYQNVTIGNISGENPTIGDNVQITTSSVVIGNISIGNNTSIGANTTVTKSVPENCTVVGRQGVIVKENGERVLKEL